MTERLANMWKELPETVRYDPDCWNSGQPYHECYVRLLIHLDYLYSHFLLQRVLMKHSQSDISVLLNTARELLSTVLTLASQRDRLWLYQSDIAWNVRQ